ncbi:sensor histidine kinase [Larkinella knui]|uniref:Histidine kinase n=1 Tax=Larkinella knui TaxID=2025310 RepID=A0A3P1CPS1_9BACT|nr:sensor histidine kinase [Larkinella knui]RRB15238.1 histidine kinase [Larkinella knui]
MSNHYLLRLIGLAFLIGFHNTATGQSQPIQFERIGSEQGLSQTDVHYIIQDRRGYLWFGTTDGLNKYDGYSCTTYKYDPSDTTSLSQNTCLMLWEDKQGMIWIGLVGEGICKFDPTTEKFTRYLPNRSNHFALPDGVVFAFNEDDENMLWVGTGRISEILRLDKTTGQFHQTSYNPPNSRINQGIYMIYQDRSKIYWIATEKGLHQAWLIPAKGKQPSQVKFIYNPLLHKDQNLFRDLDLNGIYEDHAGILWFGTDNKGLISYDRKNNIIRQYRHNPNDPNSLSNNTVRRGSIAEDQQGNLWVGTYGGGLNKLNKDRTTITHYVYEPENTTGLSSNNILGVLIDRSNILWIGTVGGGISKFDPNRQSFPVYRHLPHDPNSLTPYGIRALCEDKAGTVWVGTEGGGLDRLDKKTGQFTHFRYQSNKLKSLANDIVTAILEDRKGTLWLANANLLLKLNRITGAFEPYFNATGGVIESENDYIFTLFEDHAGLIWLGTTNGLKSINTATGVVAHYDLDPNDAESLSDYWAYVIREDSYHNLWIGTYDGLNYFNRKTGKFKHYKHRNADSHSISSNTIRSLFIDEKGILWVGTLGGGLCRFNEKTDSFTNFTEQDGLANNSVYAIQSDQEGDLWLATNKGLSQFSPSAYTFINFDISDGLQSDQFASGYFNAGASFKGKDGVLYFGGINGFNAFNPKKIQLNRQLPAIVITKFKLFDRYVSGKAEAAYINLNYNENFFSFEFAALNYTNTPKNRYAYQLEGVDSDWIFSGARRYVSYTNLDPGTYIFRVKGSNNDGLWNEKGISVLVIIHPPWWQTSWFRLLVVLWLILITGVSIRYYTRFKLRRQRIELKKVLQAQEEERQRLAADLHDDLGATLAAIKGTLEIIHPPTDGLVKPITMMEKAIRDLRHISHNLMPPEFAKLGLSEIIQETVRRAEEGSALEFEFITFGQERRLDNQTELTIYRIAVELMQNAIRHSKASRITVQLIFYPQYVTLLVEDNGRGYMVSEEESQSGIGLRNIRSRVAYLGSRLLIDSGERGTTITLQVPL